MNIQTTTKERPHLTIRLEDDNTIKFVTKCRTLESHCPNSYKRYQAYSLKRQTPLEIHTNYNVSVSEQLVI